VSIWSRFCLFSLCFLGLSVGVWLWIFFRAIVVGCKARFGVRNLDRRDF